MSKQGTKREKLHENSTFTGNAPLRNREEEPEPDRDRGPDGCSGKPDGEGELWNRLEAMAKQRSKQLAGTLNGFRHMGARLWVEGDGSLTIRPEPGEGWGEPSMCTFNEDADEWIERRGHTETLNEILRQLEDEDPSDRGGTRDQL